MTENALIPLDDEEALGPAMRALSERWRAFVTALLNGHGNKDAARFAGFKATDHNLEESGRRLAHHPKIQAALQEEGLKLLRTQGVVAMGVLGEIVRSPVSADRDRISAAKELLARSFPVTTQHHTTVVHKTERQVDDELNAVLIALGLDADTRKKLVSGAVVDAEFVEIAPKATESERATYDDLADLLGPPLANESGVATDFDPTTEEENEDE